MDPPEDFAQLRLHFTAPIQHDYEMIQLLFALFEYGCPEGLVSDNGSVFTADAYKKQLLPTLEIEACTLTKGKRGKT